MSITIFFGNEDQEDSYAYGQRYAFAFDGLWGRRGGIHMEDGSILSESRLAADLSAETITKIVEQRLDDWTNTMDYSSPAQTQRCGRAIARELDRDLTKALRRKADEFKDKPEWMATTVAGWITFPMPNGQTLGVALWAGDSRCYAIDAEKMRLFSKDDTIKESDAMEDCLGDSLGMSNFLSLSQEKPVHLNSVCHVFNAPTLLVAATDGFYKRIPSPMHLEYWFRRVGKEKTFDDMAQAWQDFVLNEDHFDDDCETAVSIFLNSDPEDAAALGAMLTAPLEELRRKYIDPFPENIKFDEKWNIDDKISEFAEVICDPQKPYRFHDIIRDNVRRCVAEDLSFPEDMPCSAAVKQIREDYKWRIRRRSEQAEGEREEARRRIGDQVACMQRWEPYVKVELAPTDRKTNDLLRNGYGAGSLIDRINRLFDVIVNNIDGMTCGVSDDEFGPDNSFDRPFGRFYGRPGMGGRNGYSRFDSERERARNADYMAEIERAMVKLCALLNGLARMAGAPELKQVIAGRPIAAIRKVPLTPYEQETVVEMVTDAAKGRPGSFDAVKQMAFPLAEFMGLIEPTQAFAEIEKTLEKIDAENIEPDMEILEGYLEKKPYSDAIYLMKTLDRTERFPQGFEIPSGHAVLFERNLESIRKMRGKLDALVKRQQDVANGQRALWKLYKSEYECWNEPLYYYISQAEAAQPGPGQEKSEKPGTQPAEPDATEAQPSRPEPVAEWEDDAPVISFDDRGDPVRPIELDCKPEPSAEEEALPCDGEVAPTGGLEAEDRQGET